MKRLLAYLFIVFGLGLTFSANSKADNYCIPKQAEKDYFNTIYIFNKCYIYHKKVDLNTFVEFALTHPLNSVGTQKGSPFIVEENLKWLKKYLRENNISKSKINKSIKRVKIVKKELGKTQKVAKEKSENLYVERMLTKKEKLDFAKGKIKIYKCSTSTGTHLQMDDCIGDYYKKKLLPNKGLVNFYLLRDYTKTQIAKAEPSQTQKVNIANCREVNALSGKVRFLKNNEAPIVYKNINIDFLNKRIEFEKNKDWVKFNNTNEKIYKTNFKHGSEDNIILTHVVAMHAGTSLLIKINYDLGIVEQGQYQQMKLICEKINNTKTQFAKLFDSKSLNIEKTQIAKVEPSQTQEMTTVDVIFCGAYEELKYVSNCSEEYYVSYEKWKSKRVFKAKNLCVNDALDRIGYLLPTNCSERSQAYGKKMYNVKFISEKSNNVYEFKILGLDQKAKKLLAKRKKEEQTQIAKAKPTVKPKKKVKVDKVEEPKQEEFKPKKTNQDNEAPVIEIAEVITVNDSSYEFAGKVTDKAKTIYVEVDGRLVDVNKKGQFVVKGYSPIDKEISITAFDQWDNRSEPKIVKLTIDIKDTNVAEKLEPLNPSKIRSKSSNNKIALIIGIENYSEAPKANYANLDAKYFFDYARKAFGVKKQNINLLVNEEATVVKTDKALSLWLKSKIKKDKSELIIFFAGHGLASTDGKELYLLPQDGNPDRLERTAISRTDLFKEIIALSPKSVTMFLDTCYSGVSRDEQMLLASARPIRIVADEQERIPDNFTIFSASRLDQISSGLKEAKHGIFSYYLMKGLEGKADANNDKDITNGELLAYMDQNVAQKASELGRQQNPSFAGDPDKVLVRY